MAEKVVNSEPRMKILEAMSFIYEICMKRDIYKLENSDEFYKQLLKTYNDLQLLRDDTLFLPVETDLNDKFLKKLKQKRVEELTAPPFNTTTQNWIK